MSLLCKVVSRARPSEGRTGVNKRVAVMGFLDFFSGRRAGRVRKARRGAFSPKVRLARIEPLEQRRLLSVGSEASVGPPDVQAELVDGLLLLTGDDLDNQIRVDAGGNGSYTVHGRRTLINGSSRSARRSAMAI